VKKQLRFPQREGRVRILLGHCHRPLRARTLVFPSLSRRNRTKKEYDRFQCRLLFCDFQSIEIPWDSGCGYESSASDEWRICDARTQRGELLRSDPPRSNNRHRRNLQHRSDRSQQHLASATCFKTVSFHTAPAVSSARENR